MAAYRRWHPIGRVADLLSKEQEAAPKTPHATFSRIPGTAKSGVPLRNLILPELQAGPSPHWFAGAGFVELKNACPNWRAAASMLPCITTWKT